MNNTYNPSSLDTGTINPNTSGNNTITPGNANMINPNQIQPSPINPGLFSNTSVLQQLNPGSAYNQSQPIMPPNGVQTSITPVMGIENQ
jgi:hypothetical protein